MNKTEWLNRFAQSNEDRILLARILDQQDRAEQRGIPTYTAFLSPSEQARSADLLMASAPGSGFLFGGYPEAERRLWVFLPDWLEEETWRNREASPVQALQVTVPSPATLTHRDYLGSMMGLGLTRETIGDLLLTDTGAQVLVLTKVLPILLSQWERVGRYPITLAPMEWNDLTPVAGKTRSIHATVASLRLDGVLAAGFSIPRRRAAELIRGGRVMVNHRLWEKGDRPVVSGDVLTCRGLGKCVLLAVGNRSKRGRIRLELEQYI